MTRLAILAAVLLLAGCGGGGGGGDGASGGSGSGGTGGGGTGSGGTGSGGTGSGGTGGGSSTGPGNAAILFPLPHSGATSATLVVRGTASDPDGVARVLVNGVSATLETVAASKGAEIAGAKIRTGSAAPSWPRKGTASTLAEDGGTEVEWSAEVDLEGGENEISVSVEDSLAAATENADSAVVDYLEVPVGFTLDAAQSRVVGVSSTSTWNGVVRRLVEHDFLTRQQIIHAVPDPSPGCLSTGTREFLSLVLDLNGSWAIHRVSLEDDAELSAVPIPSDVLDPGPGFDSDPYMMRLVCTPEGEKSYVLVDYADDSGSGGGDSGFAKSRILEVQLSPPAVSVLSETDPTAPTPWIAEDLALWDGALVGLHGISASAPLKRIDLADGEPSDLTPGLNVGGIELAPAATQGLIYVVRADDQVDEIDVARVARRTVSAPDPASPFAFANVRSAAFDAAGGRVIVGDSSLDALVAVNTASGERSDFLSHRIGSGVPLIAPRRIAVSSDGSKAYILDDGDNAAERLFEIDLATGDRRVVGDMDMPFNVPVTGMALDEPGERAYVAFPTSVVAVDIASGAVQTVTSDGLLSTIADLALDAENGRLLITNFTGDSIVAVDLASREQTIFSKAGERGMGDGLSGPTSLSIDSESSVLYVVDSNAGDVTRVDLESGDREVAIGECSIGGSNLLPHDGQFGQVLFNANGNELLILGDQPLRVDLGTSLCGRIWPVRPAPTLLAVALTPSDQLLAVTFGQLLQLDRRSPSGQLVVVSR